MSARGEAATIPALDQRAAGRGALRWLMDQLSVVVAAFVLTLGLRAWVIEPFRIPSESMLPTLRSGDHVFAAKWVFGAPLPFTDRRMPAVREPTRGEVVVFELGRLGSQIAPRDDRPEFPVERFVKRLVGLPGDHVESRAGRLFVNDVAVERWPTGEIWVDAAGRRLAGFRERLAVGEHPILLDADRPGPDFAYDVPEGRYFVMGDHRDHSGDSRYLGTVPRRDLIGPVAFIYWSWDVGDDPARWDSPSSWWRALSRTRWNRVGEAIE